MKNHATKKGFTLTEILIALGIFAIGGTAIMALFITNVRLSAQAMDYTRAAEIQRNVRSLLTTSLSRPITVADGVSVYEFTYPTTSLTFVPSEYMADAERNESSSSPIKMEKYAGSSKDNIIYFQLPFEDFNADLVNLNKIPDRKMQRVMSSLPNEACDVRGRQVRWESDAPKGPEVFRFSPARLREAKALFGFDKDDRMFYSFDFTIRRSVARADIPDEARQGRKQQIRGLYVIHLRVYKGFSLPEENGGVATNNTPIYETDFLISAAR